MMPRRMLLPLFALTTLLSATPLNQHERDYAMSELHATRKQFLDAVAGLSPAQWNYKPAPNRWSIAEVAEHIALSEPLIFEVATKKAMASPAQPDRERKNTDLDEKLAAMLLDRSKKFNAPEALTPAHKFKDAAQTAADFKQNRDRSIAYVEKTSDDLRAHFVKHPAFGELDAYQWLVMMSGHTARHVAQIYEVKAEAGYPNK